MRHNFLDKCPVTTDGAVGLIKAVEAVFPKSLRIRCWYHRMKNFHDKVPKEVWPEIKAEIMTIRDAAGYEQGKQRALSEQLKDGVGLVSPRQSLTI